MPVYSPDRLRRDLVDLVHRAVDVRDFSFRAARILGRAVPFDGVCLVTLDPATSLPTSEIGGDHVNGFGDELRSVLSSEGVAWGRLTLLRGDDREPFTPADAALVGSLSTHLAEGVRRATLLAALNGRRHEDAAVPGLVLLDDDGGIAMADAAAESWLDQLGARDRRLPDVVSAVANRARRVADGAESLLARARVCMASGAWLVVRASTLQGDGDARTAVTLEPARPHDLAPLIADAYQLTEQERRVTRLVALGLTTAAIANRLHISSWTVQDHLKSIFDKADVSTRGELIARLFFDGSTDPGSWDCAGRGAAPCWSSWAR